VSGPDEKPEKARWPPEKKSQDRNARTRSDKKKIAKGFRQRVSEKHDALFKRKRFEKGPVLHHWGKKANPNEENRLAVDPHAGEIL